VNVRRDLWRGVASSVRPVGARFGVLALACAGLVASAGASLAQGVSEQQVRCMQLQQELAAAQGGGGANREELGRIDQQIAKADRVFQGTQAAMEDAGCFDSFFIFGRGLVRNPKCLGMNARVEDARRQLTQLQQQRQVLLGGGGNRRRQAELQDALARSGCGGQVRPARRGLFDFLTGRDEEEEELPRTPIYRSIDPNGRYRSVCVRLCDGFFYPIHYSVYGSMIGPDAEACQASCAAPAELYVYRNPGQEIEHAVSLTGSAYMDLPVALRYRKEYVKGCSCKQAEYNPTEIEAANKRAGIDAGPMPPAAQAPAAGGQPATQAAAPAAATVGQPALDTNVEITGSTPPADPAAPAPAEAAVSPPQATPAPPGTAAPPPPPATSAAVEQAPPPAKPATAPKRQKPPAPPQAAAPPPPPASAEAPPERAAPKPRPPAAPKASPFAQF
jgi:hypothetical protein